MKLKNCKKEVTEFLEKVKTPIVYTGNEVNSVHKEPDEKMIRFGLAFPDTYQIGMSHIGLQILYGLLNEYKDVWAERVFAPWFDMEEMMVENGVPLYGLESFDPIKNFDFVGFTLQYEMSYTNILNMLSLAHIPLESNRRTDNDPFIIAGGPGAYNPEPLADFIDLFIIGESEEVIPELLDVYRKWKREKQTRDMFLLSAAQIEGVYVPKLYSVEYNNNGTIRSFNRNTEQAKSVVKKRFVSDMNNVYYPKKLVIPYSQIEFDRISYEILRGCPHGCRFCQAGQIYRPFRQKSKEVIVSDIQKLLANTGYDEVSLASLSTGDHSEIETVLSDLVQMQGDQKIKFALPSLRVGSVNKDLLSLIQTNRAGVLTIAPEAGTERLRDVINKNIKDEEITNAITDALSSKCKRIKLYFMMGLPTEKDSDLEGIAQIVDEAIDIYNNTPKNLRSPRIRFNISASYFVPKPFTPFQWEGQISLEEYTRREKFLSDRLKKKNVEASFSNKELSFLEAVIARGDRKVGKVIKRAWELGCHFDSWSNKFDYSKWKQAFEECNIRPDFYATRPRHFAEILPWDFIDIGVSKDFLRYEAMKARKEISSVNCKNGCEQCGMLEFGPLEQYKSSLCLQK